MRKLESCAIAHVTDDIILSLNLADTGIFMMGTLDPGNVTPLPVANGTRTN